MPNTKQHLDYETAQARENLLSGTPDPKSIGRAVWWIMENLWTIDQLRVVVRDIHKQECSACPHQISQAQPTPVRQPLDYNAIIKSLIWAITSLIGIITALLKIN